MEGKKQQMDDRGESNKPNIRDNSIQMSINSINSDLSSTVIYLNAQLGVTFLLLYTL